MQSIVYVSDQTIDFDTSLLEALSAAAAYKNRLLGLTGYLSWKNGRFFQYLEGPDNVLSEMLATIESDERHKITRIMRLGSRSSRLFSSWDMLNFQDNGTAEIRIQDLLEDIVLSMTSNTFDEVKTHNLILNMLNELAIVHDNKLSHLHANGVVQTGGKKPPFVVALGASAGGLQPLQTIVKALVPEVDAAFIVIQHFAPETETMMDMILQRETRMPVCAAEEGMCVEAGKIFVIPPGENLEVFKGCFHLSKQYRLSGGPQYPIDICFHSLALEYGDKSLAVVLSGTGSDGSLGALALQEAGGVVLVQTPDTSEFDGMPSSSIEAGAAHQVLTPPEIAEFINCLGEDSLSDSLAIHPERRSQYIKDAVDILANHDIDFSEYKEETLFRRIERRRLLANIPTTKGYIDFLRDSDKEQQGLRDDVLITVTSFFRDPEAWDNLKDLVLPTVQENLQTGDTFRAWVAACSTGEEAYTVAMVLTELIEETGKNLSYKVYATDIERRSLDHASTGTYSEHSLTHINPKRRERFFSKTRDGYTVNQNLREHVIFAPHNFIKDAPFTRMHLVTCRNVLIYMQPELQQKALKMLHFSLNVGGILFLGASETLGSVQSEFTPVCREWNQFRKLRDIRLPLHLNSARTLTPSNSSTNESKYSKEKSAISNLCLDMLSQQSDNTNVLVTESRAIISVISDPTGILQVHHGEPTVDISKMVPEGIGPSLTYAIDRAIKEQTKVVHGNILCEPIGQASREVDIEVIPHKTPDGQASQYALIVISNTATALTAEKDADSRDLSTLEILRAERDQARQALQVAINDLESSNDGQRTVNEQLTAANEELQSTNEELQSVNEELYTVNFEYKTKIHELSDLNHDLDNLLESTNLGVIFLDSELRIRRYTDVTTRTVNLLPSDIGRPFDDLSHNLEYDSLTDDMRRVLTMGRSIELDIIQSNKSLYKVAIHPYKVGSGMAEGVLITFVEIRQPVLVSDEETILSFES